MKAVLYTAPTIEPVTLAELILHLKQDEDDITESAPMESNIKSAREDVEDMTARALLSQTWEYYLQEWPESDFIKLPFGNLQSVLSLTIADSACVEANGTYSLVFTGDCVSAASGTYTIASNVITAVSLISGGSGYVTAPTIATQSGDGSVTASLATVKWKDDDGTETTLTLGTDYLIECNGEQCGGIRLPYGETWPSGTLYPSNPIAVRFRCGWTTAALVPYKIKAAILMICADLYMNREAQAVGAAQIYFENRTVRRLLDSSRLWDEF